MKQTAGSGKTSGFRWGGERIVFYSLPYKLPYTAQQLTRLEARLLKATPEGDEK